LRFSILDDESLIVNLPNVSALEEAGSSIPANIESNGSGSETQGAIVEASEAIEQT